MRKWMGQEIWMKSRKGLFTGNTKEGWRNPEEDLLSVYKVLKSIPSTTGKKVPKNQHNTTSRTKMPYGPVHHLGSLMPLLACLLLYVQATSILLASCSLFPCSLCPFLPPSSPTLWVCLCWCMSHVGSCVWRPEVNVGCCSSEAIHLVFCESLSGTLH